MLEGHRPQRPSLVGSGAETIRALAHRLIDGDYDSIKERRDMDLEWIESRHERQERDLERLEAE